MIVDLAKDHPTQFPHFDLVVVGTGPAGATLVNELAGSGLVIGVLESGRRSPTPAGDALRAVTSEGLPIKEYSRERVLGGTSITWAGLSSPLDPIDMTARPWIGGANGGASWPFERTDLDPFYARAGERYRFPAPTAFTGTGFGELRTKGDLVVDFEGLEEKVFLARTEPQNFGREFTEVYDRPDVHLVLDATVTELLADEDRGAVRALRVRSSGGAEFEVTAERYVLATGGIENARLLLAAREFGAKGAGNEHDQVGRCFMNHPKNYRGIVRLARTVGSAPYLFGCMYRGFAGYAGLRLPEHVQAERGLLNSYVRFEPLFPWSDSEGVESLVLMAKRTKFLVDHWRRRGEKRDEVVDLRDYSETGDDSDLQNARKSGADWLGLGWNVLRDARRVAWYAKYRVLDRKQPKITRVRLRNFMEMEPDPDNRVTLGTERDAFGVPLPRVASRCTELDRRSLAAIHAELARELARTGLGTLESDLVDGAEHLDPWPIDRDASHHLGTTRMGADPRTSVVDPHGRVHGIANLWAAGGSVFPTSGCANPTYTIVALSIRLADHLRSGAARPDATSNSSRGTNE
jgi:choline dehydrogenase-like flavoprotein